MDPSKNKKSLKPDLNFKKKKVEEKVQDTRKQIENLKVELEKLISSGLEASGENVQLGQVNINKENVINKDNQVQIIKSYDLTQSKPSTSAIHKENPVTLNKITQNDPNTKKMLQNSEDKISPKKVRTYNVKETREYMKKQKEKRVDELKSQKKDNLNNVELKKQKLQELHQKSMQLLAKNIETKRERSKSRDRGNVLRLDKTIRQRSLSRERPHVTSDGSHLLQRDTLRSKSCDKLNPSGQENHNVKKTRNYLRPSDALLISNNVTKKESIEHERISRNTFKKTSNFRRSPPKLCKEKPGETVINNKSRRSLSHERLLVTSGDSRDTNQSKLSDKISLTVKTSSKLEENFDLLQPPQPLSYRNISKPGLVNIQQTVDEGNSQNHSESNPDKIIVEKMPLSLPQSKSSKIDEEKENPPKSLRRPPLENITMRVFQNTDSEAQNLPTFKELNKDFTTTSLSLLENISQRSSHLAKKAAVATNLEQSQKNLEIVNQHSQILVEPRREFPSWLQESPAQPYPHNFINTVKRKLQFVVNSPKPTVDVGIQNSLASHNNVTPITPENAPKTKEEIKELLQKSAKSQKPSDLMSFKSHKCLNLDPKPIQHLELITNKSNKSILTGVESESDTSKNIPDISSESGTSLKRNAESVKKSQTTLSKKNMHLHINTDRLDNMRLNQRKDNHSKQKTSSSDLSISNEREANSRSQKTQITTNISENLYTTDASQNSVKTSLNLNNKNQSSVGGNRNNSESEVDESFIETPAKSSRDSIIASNVSNYSRTPESIKSYSSSYAKSTEKHSTNATNIPEIISSDQIKYNKTNVKDPSKSISSEKLKKSSASNIPTNSSVNTSTKEVTTEGSFKSLLSELRPSEPSKNRSSLADSVAANQNSQLLGSIDPLKEPTMSLRVENNGNSIKNSILKNVSIRTEDQSNIKNLSNTNEIHLKFNAEIHLLNDFNESLRQFSAVEKAFESLKTKNNTSVTTTKILQNRDTQTSLITRTSSETKISEKITCDDGGSQISTINYSRGSNIADDSNLLFEIASPKQADDSVTLYTGLEMTNLNQSIESSINDRIEFSNCENIGPNKFAGLSLRMFEQFIKDEDVRLENLKTILKIREQALLDRTKGELAYLEIQRKHLKETGKLHEASLVKKKQRGILLKHQQERHEMQRLKQMQKAASHERKIILKEQRNLIKAQLSTDNMLSKIKVSTPREARERRQSIGPLRVIQSHSESILSETSISRKSSAGEEILSMASHSHSVISRVSELETNVDTVDLQMKNCQGNSHVPMAHMKRTLLMREAALLKRRKAAEDLLKWHRKLLEEEKRITELEQSANKIISQIPNSASTLMSGDVTEKYKFTGKQLNQLWENLTGSVDKKFSENKIYPMSQIALERFCKSAKEYSSKTKKILSKVDSFSDINSSYAEVRTDYSISEISENIPETQDSQSDSVKTQTEKSDVSVISKIQGESQKNDLISTENIPTVNEYTSEFDGDSTAMDDGQISSISQLIDNFSKVKDEISLISHNSKKSSEIQTPSNENNQIQSEDVFVIPEPSVIVTEKDSKESGEVETVSLQHIVSDEEEKHNSDILSNLQQSLLVETENPTLKDQEEEETISIKHISTSEIETKEPSLPSDKNEEIQTSSNVTEELEKQSVIVSQVEPDSEKESEINEVVYHVEADSEKESEINEVVSHVEMGSDKESEINEDINKKDSKSSSSITATSLKDMVISAEKTLSKLESIISSKLKSAEETNSEEPADEKSVETAEEQPEILSIAEGSIEKLVEPTSEVEIEEVPEIDENASQKDLVELEEEIIEDKNSSQLETEENSSKLLMSIKENTVDDASPIVSESNSNAEKTSLLDLSYGIIATKEPDDKKDDEKNEETAPTVTSSNISKSNKYNEEYEVETETEKSFVSQSKASDEQIDTKEINSFEEKEQDSLSSSTQSVSEPKSTSEKEGSQDLNETSIASIGLSQIDISDEKTISPKNITIDVKKRVSEIMADTSQVYRGDKSPRLQDLYVTTYDVVSPPDSPELDSSQSDSPKSSSSSPKSSFGSEAEELLKKQLAIEQEIKQLEQQQKEQLPYVFIREIPNKPPPPYTPPSSLSSTNVSTVLPTNAEEIDEITKYSAKIIHKAYLSNNLENIIISENTLNLITKNDIGKECYKFVFDLCKEIAKNHYKQFEKAKGPSWLTVTKKPQLASVAPLDAIGLEKLMNKKLQELFGFKKIEIRENAIIKWSRKKRDHVDEILVIESQAEESEWINFEKDELLVIEEVTSDIMKSLLAETADVFSKILSKRNYLY